MTDRSNDLHQTKRGTAVLFAVLVQTLEKSSPGFEGAFLERLAKAYAELRDNSDADPIHALEMLAWTRTLLTGFDFVSGQGEPFLGGH